MALYRSHFFLTGSSVSLDILIAYTNDKIEILITLDCLLQDLNINFPRLFFFGSFN